MPQRLDQSAAPATEHKQMPAVGIALERLLDHERQAIETLAHVGVPSRQPNPRSARHRDHRRRLLFASARITANTVEASTGPVIRTRPPAENSISIMPARSDAGVAVPGPEPGAGVSTVARAAGI